MTSELKIDTGGENVLNCVQVVEDVVMKYGDEIDAVCWQRLKPRLSPDRERVARAIRLRYFGAPDSWDALDSRARNSWLRVADAAINAMGKP